MKRPKKNLFWITQRFLDKPSLKHATCNFESWESCVLWAWCSHAMEYMSFGFHFLWKRNPTFLEYKSRSCLHEYQNQSQANNTTKTSSSSLVNSTDLKEVEVELISHSTLGWNRSLWAPMLLNYRWETVGKLSHPPILATLIARMPPYSPHQ